MQEVAIIGIGQVPVGEHWGKRLVELAGEAVFAALKDAELTQVEALYVGNMMAGQLDKQSHLGALISDWIGMRGIEAMTVEAACGSGALALRTAMMAVGSGIVTSALAVGVEKMTDTSPRETTSALATAASADWEGIHGVTFVGLNALIMRRYMHEYGWQHEDFAPFSINAHANGAKNPNARFQRPITADIYKKAVMIADPINLMDASPINLILKLLDQLSQRIAWLSMTGRIPCGCPQRKNQPRRPMTRQASVRKKSIFLKSMMPLR